jgi:hypothetical protein
MRQTAKIAKEGLFATDRADFLGAGFGLPVSCPQISADSFVACRSAAPQREGIRRNKRLSLTIVANERRQPLATTVNDERNRGDTDPDADFSFRYCRAPAQFERRMMSQIALTTPLTDSGVFIFALPGVRRERLAGRGCFLRRIQKVGWA